MIKSATSWLLFILLAPLVIIAAMAADWMETHDR